MEKRIVIAGGSGFIGAKLSKLLKEKGFKVINISRSPDNYRSAELYDKNISWEEEELIENINGAYGVVNLAGAEISERWTTEQKRKILNSRVDSTKRIVDSISKCEVKPVAMFSASGVNYYKPSGDAYVDENTGPGVDFLSKVCAQWENEANKAEKFCRLTIGRIGIALDKSGGALEKLLTSFKMYIGGSIGSGKQWVPWIHIQDVLNMIIWALENEKASGPINLVSPNPVRMVEFTENIGTALGKPSIFKVPGFVVKAALGEAAVLVLEGNRVIPRRAQDLGYDFKYQKLGAALKDILGQKNS